MSSPQRSQWADLSAYGGDDELPVKIKPEFKNNLTRTQESIVDAIEKGDKFTFEKLGGLLTFDLNFEITSDGIFPLLLASAKGDKEMVAMIVTNPNTRINKTDAYGVNAFWVAAFYGHVDVRFSIIIL